MKFMEWGTPNGCATCRPALNYYLISTWPHEAQDDPQSRFINERAHANIQKDGTYSVIPRMWGGETNASELRRIADVVDKYQIPSVKVTGGQRIDLLGVKKADLPAVWKDLGMPSGLAYAKGLRTVKTCVGSEWCRFGTQNSTLMGQQLERALARMYAPHKVKLAVSGCPRNCAEVAIKEVHEETGIIAEPVALMGVVDGMRMGFSRFGMYMLLFHMNATGGELNGHPLETGDVGWFAADALPSPVPGAQWWGPMAFDAINGVKSHATFDSPRDQMWRGDADAH